MPQGYPSVVYYRKGLDIIMVYIFLADGFEEIEALTPADLLRRAGVEVALAGVTGEVVTGAHGIKVVCDITAEEAAAAVTSPAGAEMIILPGGLPGADNLDASDAVSRSIEAMKDSGGFIAAICAAPYILGKRGILDGRMATCYPGFEDRLTGAETYDCDVIRDGEIITGRAMGSATEFALELVEALKGESAAEKLRDAIIA